VAGGWVWGDILEVLTEKKLTEVWGDEKREIIGKCGGFPPRLTLRSKLGRSSEKKRGVEEEKKEKKESQMPTEWRCVGTSKEKIKTSEGGKSLKRLKKNNVKKKEKKKKETNQVCGTRERKRAGEFEC